MIFNATGVVADGLYVCGLATSPVYLLESSNPILIEAGFSCAAHLYEKDLQRALRGRDPGMLFITHSHWDHCGAAAFLKQCYPGLQIAASPDTARILSSPKTRKVMSELGAAMARGLRTFLCEADSASLLDHPFQPFCLDMHLVDGQSIKVEDNLTVQVLATPGHTRDHLSFYIPERRILFGGEASGCLEAVSGITPEFLVDYDGYIRSLRRLTELDADIYCLPHHYVLVGRDEVKKFLALSLEATEMFADKVHAMLDREADDVDRVLHLLGAEYHLTEPGLQQPLEAYLLNLKAQVTHLYKRRKHNKLLGVFT